MQVLPSHNQYLSEQLKLILKSLPILVRIEELSTLGRLEKEKAALVKRQLTTSLEDLIRSNTIIEEMFEHWQRDPRVAMQLTPRLTSQNIEESVEDLPEYATQQRVNPFIKKSTDYVAPVQSNLDQNINILSEAEKKRFLSKLKLEMSDL